MDATIVWDAVAANYPDLAVVKVPELDGAVGKVELAILASAPDPADGDGKRIGGPDVATADRCGQDEDARHKNSAEAESRVLAGMLSNCSSPHPEPQHSQLKHLSCRPQFSCVG